jgi:hypothetical protein
MLISIQGQYVINLGVCNHTKVWRGYGWEQFPHAVGKISNSLALATAVVRFFTPNLP